MTLPCSPSRILIPLRHPRSRRLSWNSRALVLISTRQPFHHRPHRALVLPTPSTRQPSSSGSPSSSSPSGPSRSSYLLPPGADNFSNGEPRRNRHGRRRFRSRSRALGLGMTASRKPSSRSCRSRRRKMRGGCHGTRHRSRPFRLCPLSRSPGTTSQKPFVTSNRIQHRCTNAGTTIRPSRTLRTSSDREKLAGGDTVV
ncbi:hypothetical protein B0H19DRAFT_1231007 [Mycena capillaripes]|nr:hypothetical protein B0H19DRAFT_1231007 [Mycena capillaripes]